MELDPEELSRTFPWLHELWLFPPGEQPAAALDVLAVAAVPPRQVAPGQRRRLQAQLELGIDRPIVLRLTTVAQLARWLSGQGRFAASFRRDAVRLFERP